MGVHPDNRGGVGLIVDNAHRILCDIQRLGLSLDALKKLHIAIEDTDQRDYRKFTSKVVCSDDGFSQMAESVLYASVSSSHLNHSMCCTLDACRTVHAEIAEEGRISQSKLFSIDGFKELCEKGLVWTVIKQSTVKKHPSLPRHIQKLKNAIDQAQKAEGVFDIIQQIASLASRDGDRPNFATIGRAVGSSNPPCADMIPLLCEFVRLWGGGVDPIFIQGLTEFASIFVASHRIIPSSTFECLNQMALKQGEAHLTPHVVVAIVKAQAKCPDAMVINRVCTFVTASDIVKLTSKKKKETVAAESILKQCRRIMSGFASDRRFVKLLANLDVRVARFLIGKQGDANHTKLDEIGTKFIKDLTDVVGVNVKDPFAADEEIEESIVETKNPAMIKFDADGSATDFAKNVFFQMGAKCDSNIVSLKDDSIAKVVEIGDEKVSFKMYDKSGKVDRNSESKTVTFGEFIEGWKLTNIVFEFLPNTSHMEDSDEYNISVVKGYCTTAMQMVNSLYKKPDVRIQLKPNKGVFTNVVFSINSLIIVPLSSKITSAKNDDKVSVSTKIVQCHVAPCAADGYAFFCSTSAAPGVFAPAAYLKDTSDKKHVNMEIEHVPIVINISNASKTKGTDTGNHVTVKFPIWRNSKRIPANTQLLFFAEKEEKPPNKKRTTMEAFANTSKIMSESKKTSR